MSNLKAFAAVSCLIFVLSFAVPAAQADTFTYTYTNTFLGISWTTAPIAGVTVDTTVTDFTATSTSGITAGCGIASATLDSGGVGATLTTFSGCGFTNASDPDAFALSDYVTPGTYAGSVSSDTLVVSAVATPEPSSVALALSEIGLLFAMRKRFGSVPHSADQGLTLPLS